jgi:hypothetical protein
MLGRALQLEGCFNKLFPTSSGSKSREIQEATTPIGSLCSDISYGAYRKDASERRCQR